MICKTIIFPSYCIRTTPCAKKASRRPRPEVEQRNPLYYYQLYTGMAYIPRYPSVPDQLLEAVESSLILGRPEQRPMQVPSDRDYLSFLTPQTVNPDIL